MWKYIKVIFKEGWRIIYAYFRWILPWSLHPSKIPFEKRYKTTQNLIRHVLKALGVEYDLINFDQYNELIKNDECCLFICNHISFIDPLAMIAIIDKPFRIIAKKETKKMIFVGRIITILDGIYLDRDDLKQQLKLFREVQNNMAEKHKSYIIFPEGTRSHSYQLNEYHHGSFRPAYKTGKPIYIMTVVGTQKVLTLDNHKHYPITAEFLERIDPETYKDHTTVQIAEHVQAISQESVTRNADRNEAMYKKENKVSDKEEQKAIEKEEKRLAKKKAKAEAKKEKEEAKKAKEEANKEN